MSTRTPLLATACAAALTAGLMLMAPGRAFANDECGSPNFGSNPQTVTCTAAFNPYSNGITYDENTYGPANQGNLQVNIAGTAAVNTSNIGVTTNGAVSFDSAVIIQNGASITAGAAGVYNFATLGNATIVNNGNVAANGFGLDNVSFGNGVGTVVNNANGVVTVTGVGAEVGIYDGQGNPTITNAGAVTINGAGGGDIISGLGVYTVLPGYAASITNTGAVSVTSGTDDAIGFGAEWTNSGSATYVNNGALSVVAGSGAAGFGFNITGGTAVSVTDAQTAAGTTSTSISGSGTLGDVSITDVTGPASATITGQALTLNSSGGAATGIYIQGGSADTVNVSRVTFGPTTYLADMSIAGVGASGVIVSANSGPASATFTGANLTVNGGTGGATSVGLFGGSSATYIASTATGAAELSVTSAGGMAEGVYLSATGAITLNAGDTFTVTNTAGAATGAFLNGGTSATATFANGLTVSATGGQARGLDMENATGLTAAHLNGTISVRGTGGAEVEGVYASNALGGVTIDGAQTINVTGGGFTAGVYATSNAGPITASLGNITSQSTLYGSAAAGARLSTTGSVSVTDAGVIDVTSNGDTYGLFATAYGSSGAVNVGVNSVQLHGSTAAGSGYGIWVFNYTTGSDPTTITAQQVSTSGQDAMGIAGAAVNYGSASINVGSVLAGAHSGGVATTGVDSQGIVYSVDQNVLLTINNNGSVSTAGGGSTGIEGATAGGLGSVTVNNWQTTTAGSNSPGVVVITTIGSGVVNSNSVTTSGATSSTAIEVITDAGPVSVNSAMATTTGSYSPAINTSNGAGSTSLVSGAATTTGAYSTALLATSTSGEITVVSGLASASGDHSDAISVVTASGPITIASGTASASGAAPNAVAIYANSGSGAIAVNLADGGSTTSVQGRGVYVQTYGGSTINVGSAATTASVSGAIYGIDSQAASGTTLNVHGSVTGGGGAAIYLLGGPVQLNNAGVINGFVTIAINTPASSTFTNSGVWNVYGADPRFAVFGANTLVNTGTITINAGGAAAVAMSFNAPTSPLTVNNSGVISLQQTGVGGVPHTGDTLNLGAAAYTGTAGAQLRIDANLAAAAVGASGAQTADELLIQTGSAAGSTTIVVNDLGAGLPGRFNFVGIPVVVAGSSSASAFSLAGESINKGYVQYRLAQSGGTYDLVGLPSETAFEIVRASYEAQSLWRRSGDIWSGEMLAAGVHDSQGPTLWAQAGYDGDTQKSRPAYSVVAVNTFTFTPNLELQNDWSGAQFGLDFGAGRWGYGVTAGFGDQDGKFTATGDRIDLNGANIGAYGRWMNAGAFVDGLFKYDGFTAKQVTAAPALSVGFNGDSVGAEVQAGYRVTSGAAYVEPLTSLSWTETHIAGFNSAAAGAAVDFSRAESIYAVAGVRIGTSRPYGNSAVAPYAGAYVEGEMAGKNRATVTAGADSVSLFDPRGRPGARLELGMIGNARSGLTFSANVDADTGGSLSGLSGRVGLAFRW
jgi:hypothetical protein